MTSRDKNVFRLYGKAFAVFFLLNIFVVLFPAAILSFTALIRPQAVFLTLLIVLGSSVLSPSPLSLYLSLKIFAGESLSIKIRYCLILLLILTLARFGWEYIKADLQIQAMYLEDARRADMYKDLMERMKAMTIMTTLFTMSAGFALVIPPILFLDNLNIGGVVKRVESKEKAEVHR